MQQIFNSTPFPAQLGLFVDAQGHQTASVVLKATMALPEPYGLCRPAGRQVPILPGPIYLGEAGQSSIHHPADLVPEKPGTDLVFVGHAYAPSLGTVTELATRLRVGTQQKSVVVVGERKWVSTFAGTLMSPPLPFTRMPMVYERAFGGRPPSQWDCATPRLDERNPVGTGFCTRRRDAKDMPLPNLEDPEHRIRTWRDRPPVAGLGAVDAHWLPRRDYAGTYDAHWKAKRCPVLPSDFDPRHHCVAAEGLSSAAPLHGELEVELVHLAVEPVLSFRLPGARVGMCFHLDGEVMSHDASLWTILLEPDEQRVMMVWGASLRIGKRPAALSQVEIEIEWA